MSCNLIELCSDFLQPNVSAAILSGISALCPGVEILLSKEHLKEFANAYSTNCSSIAAATCSALRITTPVARKTLECSFGLVQQRASQALQMVESRGTAWWWWFEMSHDTFLRQTIWSLYLLRLSEYEVRATSTLRKRRGSDFVAWRLVAYM